MNKNLFESIVCVIFMLLLLLAAVSIQQINVELDTKENINTGYRPDIARHIAEVDNGVIEPDSLYISLMED